MSSRRYPGKASEVAIPLKGDADIAVAVYSMPQTGCRVAEVTVGIDRIQFQCIQVVSKRISPGKERW